MNAPAVPAATPEIGICRSCSGSDWTKVLDLGLQTILTEFPAASDRGPDPVRPLTWWRCDECGLLQLGERGGGRGEETPGMRSDTAAAHALEESRNLVESMGMQRGDSYVCVFSPHGDSWNDELSSLGFREAEPGGAARLVLDVFGVMHAEEFDKELAASLARVAEGGRYAIETQYGLSIVADGEFDTIRHGHPVYLTLHSLQNALRRHGFEVLSSTTTDSHGTALLLVAGRDGEPDESVEEMLLRERRLGLHPGGDLSGLQSRADTAQEQLLAFLTDHSEAGHVVAAYGAPSRGISLLNSARIDSTLIAFTADRSPAKQGKRIPGTDIPIRSPEELIAATPDIVVILTWDIAEEVRQSLRALDAHGTIFYVPVSGVRQLESPAGRDGTA